eukprot:4276296-Prymnesium_polylepis.1
MAACCDVQAVLCDMHAATRSTARRQPSLPPPRAPVTCRRCEQRLVSAADGSVLLVGGWLPAV